MDKLSRLLYVNGHMHTSKQAVERPIEKTEEKFLPGHRKTYCSFLSVGWLCLIITIICILIVNILLQSWKTQSDRKLSFRLPCDDVSLSVSEDLRMVRDAITVSKDVNGRSICEFDNITYIAEKATERVLRRRRSSGRGSTRYIACGNEKYADNQSLYTAFFTEVDNTTENQIDNDVQWIQERTSSFIGDSFVYTNGRVRVNTTSFFYIYCSVTVRDGTDTKQHSSGGSAHRPNILYVSLNKRNSNYENAIATRLLENRYLICEDNCNGTTTLQIGSNMLLDRGDEVFVRISHKDRLVRNPGGNNFGIFRME